jgi:hypothetical protein
MLGGGQRPEGQKWWEEEQDGRRVANGGSGPLYEGGKEGWRPERNLTLVTAQRARSGNGRLLLAGGGVPAQILSWLQGSSS